MVRSLGRCYHSICKNVILCWGKNELNISQYETCSITEIEELKRWSWLTVLITKTIILALPTYENKRETNGNPSSQCKKYDKISLTLYTLLSTIYIEFLSITLLIYR